MEPGRWRVPLVVSCFALYSCKTSSLRVRMRKFFGKIFVKMAAISDAGSRILGIVMEAAFYDALHKDERMRAVQNR